MRDIQLLYSTNATRHAIGFLGQALILFTGCRQQDLLQSKQADLTEQNSFSLNKITQKHATQCLAKLGIHTVTESDDELLTVAGTFAQLEKAGILLDIILNLNELVFKLSGERFLVSHSQRSRIVNAKGTYR
jgi:hypothetical protein